MKFWEFKNQASANGPELFVYGDIGEWADVDSRTFAAQLGAIDSDIITVRINSGGGAVFTAQAIYSMLKSHKAAIQVRIDGLAASAATIIAMAGDEIIMPRNAMMMIHNPLSLTYGNADELRDFADVLDKVRDTLVSVYQSKTGLDAEKIIELMDAETYMSADEALEYGFIDVVGEQMKIAASAKGGEFFVNGVRFDENRLPKTLIGAKTTHIKPQEPEIMDIEKLKAEHPEVFRAAVAVGVDQERQRIKAIEDIAIAGHDDLTAKAKFDSAISAEAFAVELVKAEKAVKVKFLADRQADAADVSGVKPNPETNADAAEEKRKSLTASIGNAFKSRNSK